jgi:quinol monooxygenase YgiN
VILRIFQARIYPNAREAFSKFLRGEAIPTTLDQPGIVACYAGEPLAGKGDEFVFVSIWRDLKSLEAFRGSDLDDPGLLPHERDVIRDASVAHYSVVMTDESSIGHLSKGGSR